MKMDTQTVNDIAAKMLVAANTHNVKLETVKTPAELWTIWHWIHGEIASDNEHPRFRNRERLFAHDRSYPLYPCDTNDNSLQTGLTAALRRATHLQNSA